MIAVGHRVTRGGAEHLAPAAVTDALHVDLEVLTALDPLRMPHEIAPIRGVTGHGNIPITTETGALVSVLGQWDGQKFTGGITEHTPAIRAAGCARLAWLGLRLDADAQAAGDACMGAQDSGIDVRVIATDGEAMIARHTMMVLADH